LFNVVVVASGFVAVVAAAACFANATNSNKCSHKRGTDRVVSQVSLATCCCLWQMPSPFGGLATPPAPPDPFPALAAVASFFFLRLTALCQHLIVVFAFATARKGHRTRISDRQ